MAKQKGAVKLSGTIGDITFYQSQNDFLAREKTGPSRRNVLTDDHFERTRENSSEFGHCSRTGKLLRSALGLTGGTHPDATLPNRLQERLVRVMHSDTRSPRGQRSIQRGQLALLEGFEFLKEARLSESLLARYTAAYDRSTGTCSLTLPSFIPSAAVAVPPHAKGVKLVATALALDLEHYRIQTAGSASEPLLLGSQPTAPLTLSCSFAAPTPLPTVLVLGLQFMDRYEGFYYPLREKEFNALSVVLAENESD